MLISTAATLLALIGSGNDPIVGWNNISSGDCASGVGDKKAYYTLCTKDLPPNTHISFRRYNLLGDRNCTTGWATCEIVADNIYKFCVSFMLQGHSEDVYFLPWGSDDGVRYSKMEITYIVDDDK